MARNLQLKMLLLCCMLWGIVQTYAQGWTRDYLLGIGVNTVYSTRDSGFFITGWADGQGGQHFFKVDAAGNVLWQYDLPAEPDALESNITQDGGLITLNPYYRYLLRVDSMGHKMWSANLPSIPHSNNGGGAADVDTTDNGGFIIAASAYDSSIQKTYIHIDRLDANGNAVWGYNYYASDSVPSVSYIRNSKTGGFIISMGRYTSLGWIGTIFKIDGNGTFLWEFIPPGYGNACASVATDGNILVLSTPQAYGPGSVYKLNQSGAIIRTQTYPALPEGYQWTGPIIERADKTFAIRGDKGDWNNAQFCFSIADSLGNLLAFKKLSTTSLGTQYRYVDPGAFNYISGAKNFAETVNGEFIFGGWMLDIGNGGEAFLIKTDSPEWQLPNVLSGKVYYDHNQNCIVDSADTYLNNVLVTLTSSRDTLTFSTIDSGNYSFGVDSNIYTLGLIPPSPYWQSSACNISNINLPSNTDSIVYLGLTPIFNAPYITIDGHLSHIRLCDNVDYTAQYCNTGTAPFSGTIEFEVDTALSVNSSIPAWTAQQGNKYTFNVSNLGVMECADIMIRCTLTCNAAMLGYTVCVDANANPDTMFYSNQWDHSDLDMSVNYNDVTDSVTFTLKNKGTGNMSNTEDLIVIEDNVILFRAPQQLPAGAIIKQQFPANGATWRATIAQTSYNPYSYFTTAAIEGAGNNLQGPVSLGYFTQYPYNGYYAYHYNTCAETVNSVDPNEKKVSPKGAGANHLIDSTTVLEYTINFQNTGTDTARTVRVQDALAQYLDPASIKQGVSSSPYQMDIDRFNVVTFTFNNINLVDSGTNEPASNGFVQFSIKQKPGNTNGTVINNKAAIYFDYNPPVNTNTATVRLGELIVAGIQSVYKEKEVLIKAYPNPFKSSTVIEISGESFESMQLTVYDISGKVVKQQRTNNSNQFILDNTSLSTGSYVFEISSNGNSIGRGKIVVQ